MAIDYGLHPGVFLEEELEARGIGHEDFADQMGLPVSVVVNIIECRKNIDDDIAAKLEEALGASAEYWMNLQGLWEESLKDARHR